VSRYRLSKDAERDLIEIARYIAEKASLDVAERVLSEIVESIIVIAANPAIGRKEERYGKGMLSFPLQRYKIYYRARRGGIVVLHIFHGARDQKKAWTQSAAGKKKPV
jgi:plasmid stabilization system protein ParE